MSGRVVLLGATGHTGALTARSLSAAGVPLVLAARSRARLDELAARLPDTGRAELATFDLTRPDTVTALLRTGDVLVSTLGPFDTFGRPVLQAAIAAGVPYVDCCGESAFLQWAFESAEVTGASATVLPGYGFESVAGNVAAALALQEAGDEAHAVDVFYVCDPRVASRGTALSALSEIEGNATARVRGSLQRSRVGADTASISAGGRVLTGMSMTTTEPWTLPGPATVRTYLAGPRWMMRPLKAVTAATAAVRRRPAGERAIGRSTAAISRRIMAGPAREVARTAQTLVIARALDSGGREIRRVLFGGADPYTFTASVLTSASCALLDGRTQVGGPCGPVAAFGLPAALADLERAGMARIGEADESVLALHRQR